MDTMHQRNFKPMHGAKRLMESGKYLKIGKNRGRIGDTGSWGLESTQELQYFTEEPRYRHQGVSSRPHGRTREGSGEK
jgi:hypothetical protein